MKKSLSLRAIPISIPKTKKSPSYYAIRARKIAGSGGIAWVKMGFEIEDAANTAAVAVVVVCSLLAASGGGVFIAGLAVL